MKTTNEKDKQAAHAYEIITGKRLKSIFVRCSEDERAAWHAAAAARQYSLSGFIRYAVIQMFNRVESEDEANYWKNKKK